MKCPELIELHQRLEHMHEIFTRLLPIDKLDIHSFTYFRNKIDIIFNTIDKVISDSENECNILEAKNKLILSKINQYRLDLNLDIVILQLPKNLFIVNEILSNEMNKLCIMREKLEKEINIVKNEINEILLWIGDEFIEQYWEDMSQNSVEKCNLENKNNEIKNQNQNQDNKININQEDKIDEIINKNIINESFIVNENSTINNKMIKINLEKEKNKKVVNNNEDIINDNNSKIISVKNLKVLKKKVEFYKNKKRILEESREMLYEEIREICILLGKNCEFNYTESISDLMKQTRLLGDILIINKKKYNELIDKAESLELFLKINKKSFNINYSNETIDDLKNYCETLSAEKKKYFKEIYLQIKENLLEINRIFGLENIEYSEDENGLNEMMNKIKELSPKKDLFCEIGNLIEKRKLFIEKMTEFEKIASDPRRLFKSSFQLNSEEKFRNTAYPSLLNLEKSIFELIDKYEKIFDKFLFKGLEYKKSLKNEIENRIINRTVFISRCESPFKKRK